MPYKKDVSCEIIRHIGILSKNTTGWTKALNLVSWYGKEPRYDIRDWGPEHEKMGKGVTLSKDEMDELYMLLS